MKSTFRKLTALLVVFLLVLACFGCSSDKSDDEKKDGNAVASEDSGKKDDGSQSMSDSVEIGDYITFGAYEQDNDTSNGEEAIEWLVLDVQDGKALVISKYALDAKPYNTDDMDVTWENCTLRDWLNDDFINDAFSDEESAKIPTVTVSADKYYSDSADPGNATQDKVFLLSESEAWDYLIVTPVGAKCMPTAYAVANGANEYNGFGTCWWWLRSPGSSQNYVARVQMMADTYQTADVICNDYSGAVRPALWINL